MVGEQGPELFMSGTNGTIIPNHRLGGGGGAVIDYDRLAAALARQPIVVEMNGQVVGEIVRGELIQIGRRNGGGGPRSPVGV
jgi:hypothetical protein